MTTISDSHESTTSGQSLDFASTGQGRRPEARTHRRLVRAATVSGAILTTTAIFLVARSAGADFTITDPGTAKVPHTFVAIEIATVTAVFGLLGWITLATLERWTRRPRQIWAALATAVVLLSLVPIGIERATTETRIGLGLIHIAVGVALLPMLMVRPAAASR